MQSAPLSPMTSLGIRKKGEGIPRTEWTKQSLLGAHWENTAVGKSFHPVLDDMDTLPGLQEAVTPSVIKIIVAQTTPTLLLFFHLEFGSIWQTLNISRLLFSLLF